MGDRLQCLSIDDKVMKLPGTEPPRDCLKHLV